MSLKLVRIVAIAALAIAAGAAGATLSQAQVSPRFPRIPVWSMAGAFQDSSSLPNLQFKCVGAFHPRPDSLRKVDRTIAVRFLRDRIAESRPDFGGYRVYRMVNTLDASKAVLVRRFSLNGGSELSWNFSRVDSASGQFFCQGHVVHDSVVTMLDPDSSGRWIKVCRIRDAAGRCISRGDSAFVLEPPAGPHDGFLTWYSITYERKNTTDTDFEDLFIPDTTGSRAFGQCDTSGYYQLALHSYGLGDTTAWVVMTRIRNTCPNLNGKLSNVTGPTEPTGGPTADLERVGVVPNPFRGSEVWDQPGAQEIHFINLPKRSTIKIYTVSGDLVRTIDHNDAVRDFERWDLKSGTGRSVASGIYLYRVEAAAFSFQNRFVVIR